jgi:hypothetical protein
MLIITGGRRGGIGAALATALAKNINQLQKFDCRQMASVVNL